MGLFDQEKQDKRIRKGVSLQHIRDLESAIGDIKKGVVLSKIGIGFAALGVILAVAVPPRSLSSIAVSTFVLIIATLVYTWEKKLVCKYTNERDEFIAREAENAFDEN